MLLSLGVDRLVNWPMCSVCKERSSVDYWVFLTPSTGLLGGKIFLLVLKKLHFLYLNFFGDFDLFFVWIHCLIIGSLQPVTKYMLFVN